MRWKRWWAAVSVLLMAAAGTARSAWLEDVPVLLRQPDGREVQCYITGDEYFNWVHDGLGFPVLKDSGSGWYIYGERAGGGLAATNHRVGEVDPVRAGLVPGIPLVPEELEQLRRDFQAPALRKAPGLAGEAAPSTGMMQNLVVFIRCSDDPEFTGPISTYTSSFNSSEPGFNSVYNYFREISYQQLGVESHFYPPSGSTIVSYRDSHPRAYYKPVADDPLGYADATERGAREQALIRNALEAVKGQIPAGLNLDGDGDGLIDNMVFIVRGSPSAWNTLLWPHAWALYQYAVNINGKRAYSYSFTLESFVGNGSTHVLVHEMLHTIGFPDLYHYSYDGLNPVGVWDVMASPTAPPQHPGAWCKHKYGGWIPELPLLTENGTYSLQPLAIAQGCACRIPSPADPAGGEFFVVEYRRRSGSLFDSALPADGLLVYRINQSDPLCYGNGAQPDEVYIFRPDGTASFDGNLWSAPFSADAGRTLFNQGSNPAPLLADGAPGGIDLFNVGPAGSAITFSLALLPPEAPLRMTPAEGEVDVPLNVVFSWQASAGAHSYHLQLAADPGFTRLLADQEEIPLLYWPVNELESRTVYYWRIRALSSGGAGEWSGAWRFTTLEANDLPVELLSFSATARAGGIELEWATATETENYGFEIERREAGLTGGEWDKIAFVEGHHSSMSRKSYRYLDPVQKEGSYGYRLKQIDLDGTWSYLPAREASWVQPGLFALEQNYPNPFNPVTTIRYRLAEAGAVSLVIFNSRGQEVRRLVEGMQGPGEFQVKWDGCDAFGQPAAGGLYFYLLRCGEQLLRRSMALLR